MSNRTGHPYQTPAGPTPETSTTIHNGSKYIPNESQAAIRGDGHDIPTGESDIQGEPRDSQVIANPGDIKPTDSEMPAIALPHSGETLDGELGAGLLMGMLGRLGNRAHSDGLTEECVNLGVLGTLYYTHFELQGKTEDIDKAIECQSRAVQLTPDGHENKLAQLNDLGNSYVRRFERLGERADIEKAIECQHQAVSLTPEGHVDRPSRLSNLGSSYQCRFEQLGNVADIEKAIDYQVNAMQLTPDGHANKPAFLNNLGTSHMFRFRSTGELTDANQAIAYQDRAVQLTPESHPGKPARLNNLGSSYSRRFERIGERADIDKAIDCQSQAVELTSNNHAEKPALLHNLGNSFQKRYKLLGKLTDVDQAIEYCERAIQLTHESNSRMPELLNSLGISCMYRFERLGDLADIEKAIERGQRAAELTPNDRHDKPNWLCNLGNSFRSRFERLGSLVDVDQAVDYQSKAVQLAPEGHLDKPVLLNELGNSYQCRFERLGERTDIERAIDCQSRAVQLIPDGHVDNPSLLSNLGISYLRRFERLGELADVGQAIKCHDQAVQLTPEGHTNKPARLNNLGCAYMCRFKQLNEPEDVQKAIDCQTRALLLTPDGHADKPALLGNLGNSYISRFERTKELSDVNKAIEYQNQAVSLAPEGHASRSGWLSDLGDSHRLRFNCTQDHHDLESASAYFQQAANLVTGDPNRRFKAVRAWVTSCFLLGISPQAAYQRTMELVSQLAWLGSTIHQRYSLLIEIGDFALEAASWAISAEVYDRALEWLEAGRSIVWSQILQLRTPLDDLFTASPVLAKRLEQVGRELERAGSRSASTSLPTALASDLEQEAQYHRLLATQWDQLLDQARDIPGFEDFMRPSEAKKLLPAARDGPVVVINVHSSRCDALILLPNSSNIGHKTLKNFSLNEAVDARACLMSFINHRGLRSRGMVLRTSKSTPNPEKQFKAMLTTLWMNVVKPVLEFLESTDGSPDNEPKHVTWCTTGPLSFLPLHAAGCYNGSQDNAFDFLVSSYTPTLSALLVSNSPVLHPHSGVLAVGQEYKNSPSWLPNTVQELAAIKDYANLTRYLQLDGEKATVDTVLNAMGEFSWVHLACHASQDKEDPSQSAFQLHDGNLMLSTITKRQFKNKGLAFLSACQTATGDEKLPDEAVHLAAGMLMAGYPSVIATMWAIGDKDAPEVARSVYAELLKDGAMDHTTAARALHQAVTGLRKNVGENAFERWVPFIHIGV